MLPNVHVEGHELPDIEPDLPVGDTPVPVAVPVAGG
jgi:hypothetical protein